MKPVPWKNRSSSRLRLATWNAAAGSASGVIFLAAAMALEIWKPGSPGTIFWILFGAGLVITLGFGIASYKIANRVLAPVREMAERTHRLSVKTLNERLPVANPHDDLGQLATGFNETLERFENSYRDLDRLTADVSHELRTPLTAMRTVGEVALREHDPAILRDAIGSMLEEIDRINQLINRLLLLARADNNEIPVQLEAGLVSNVVAEVNEVLGRVAEEKQQRLLVECPDHLLAVFDPALLRLALMNLVQNAIHYSPPGKPILIRGMLFDNSVVIEVIDEGPGIAPQHREKIFERFYRVDKARSRADGGVGLGLAIVKWSVERMGGTVELQSEPGRGSTFRFRLRRVVD
jgi:signal transduction histidine kinase